MIYTESRDAEGQGGKGYGYKKIRVQKGLATLNHQLIYFKNDSIGLAAIITVT